MKTRLVYLILIFLFFWLVVSRLTELQQLKMTLAQGKWAWVLATLLSQSLFFVALTGSYQAAFSAVNIQTRIRDLIPVLLGSLFINVLVPFVGAGGAALFTEELSRRGKPAARAATGVLLQLVADFSAFTLLLIPGMIYLFLEHDLMVYEIIAAGIMLLMTTGLTSILLLSIWKPEWLVHIFGWSQRLANGLFSLLSRSSPLGDGWARKNAEEFSQAAAAVAGQPFRLLKTIGMALLAHVLNLTTLYLLFLAFNQSLGIGALVAGYAVGILFRIVSFTPQGVGVVEGVMTLTFSSLDVPTGVAATVTLAFRGLTFWLPMLLGFFVVQRKRAVGEIRRIPT